MTQTLHIRRERIATYSDFERFHDAPSARASSADDMGGPTVVVRRKRTVVPVSEDASTSPERQPRAPRVFRVTTPVEGSGEDGAKREDALPADTMQSSDDRLTPGRRRRRMKPAPVTIIRPNEGAEVEQAAGPAGQIDLASGAVEEKDAPRFGQSIEDHRKYVRIEQELQRLRLEAESRRQAEVAAAVAWIRKAIDDYGIDTRELGL